MKNPPAVNFNIDEKEVNRTDLLQVCRNVIGDSSPCCPLLKSVYVALLLELFPNSPYNSANIPAANTPAARAQRQTTATAFACCKHPRLGEHSLVSSLPPPLVQEIAGLAMGGPMLTSPIAELTATLQQHPLAAGSCDSPALQSFLRRWRAAS